jgi:Stage III sporulation protein AC/AD protein family.
MEVLVKCTSLAIFSALSALLIRRLNPELSFAVAAVTTAVILLSSAALVEKLLNSFRETEFLYAGGSVQIRPMLKCLGIAAISRFGADLCRDASQSALASAVETAGSLCAAAVAMPLILSVLTTIGGIL